MNQILYVAPNTDMCNIGRTVFESGFYNVDIIEGNTMSCLDRIDKLINKGIKVIIARGGTALAIRRHFNIPVVEIPITFEDIAESILKASRIGGNIAIVGYYNLINGLKLLNPLLNVKIEQVFITSDEELREGIVNLKLKGIDVIIGGEIQCRIAEENNIKFVMLNSNPESIVHAYREAKQLLDTLITERRKVEEIKAIMDHSKEGYIAANKEGLVTLINSTASNLAIANNPLGMHISECYPELINLLDVLDTGIEYVQDIATIKNVNILYDRIPLFSNGGDIIGAVAIFRDSNSYIKGESKLRTKFHSKGLIARYTLNDILGKDMSIINTIDNAKKFANTDSTILLFGETGVGKELFAQGIHNMSFRKEGPFVGVNCASLPESILESELFGYEEGAFTGAKRKGKLGLFELAHEGTLFLDEISEIPLSLQGRLLRVIQEKEVMRLGSDRIIPIDIRIITATNKNLLELISNGKFREDLYFRINVLSINIPPLRYRNRDIILLAYSFLREKFGRKNLKFTDEAKEMLIKYNWPGNIRELQNMMERISVIHRSNIINERDLIQYFGMDLRMGSANERSELTKEYVLKILKETNGNKMEAAKKIGIHRTTLWRYIKKFEIGNDDYI